MRLLKIILALLLLVALVFFGKDFVCHHHTSDIELFPTDPAKNHSHYVYFWVHGMDSLKQRDIADALE